MQLPRNTNLDTKITLIRTYIEEGPVVFQHYIDTLAEELISDYSQHTRIRTFAQGARDYARACHALDATTGSLMRYNIESFDPQQLSTLIQDKQSAWEAYSGALQELDAHTRSGTGPLLDPLIN